MIKLHEGIPSSLSGPKGSLPVREDDEITFKLAMLFEGECEGLGPVKAAKKFGYTRQRYYQILYQFRTDGAGGLKNQKRGPQRNYRRTDEVVRQIIRYRFLDPNMSPEVIAQKLNQTGYLIATRSVERVFSDYGLQKKNSISVAPGTNLSRLKPIEPKRRCVWRSATRLILNGGFDSYWRIRFQGSWLASGC